MILAGWHQRTTPTALPAERHEDRLLGTIDARAEHKDVETVRGSRDAVADLVSALRLVTRGQGRHRAAPTTEAKEEKGTMHTIR